MKKELKYATTPFDDIAFAARGNGLPALFVHGVFLMGIFGVMSLMVSVTFGPVSPSIS